MSELGNWMVDTTGIWTTLAAMALAILVFVLATKGFDWAPILVMATVPIQREMLAGPDDAHLTFTQVALAAFFAGATIRFASGRLALKVDAVTVTTGIVCSVFGLSVITSSDIGLWVAESYRWAVAGIFLVVSRAYFTPASAMRVLGALASGTVFAAGLATTQVVSEDGPSSFVRSGLLRAHGWFGEPNPFAAFIWIVTLPVLAYAVVSADRRRGLRAFAAASCLLGVGALVMTQSRGGLVGVGTGVCVMAALVLVRQPRQIRIVASLATAIIAALAVIMLVRAEPWSANGEATTSANWAEQERAAHWAAAVHMVEANPIGGVGAGGFSDQFRNYTGTWRFRISQGHAHNAYLQVAAEIGLPGLFAYGLMLAAILAAIIRRARLAHDHWLPIGAGAMTVALLTHQMVDFLHVLSLGLLFAGLWAASLPSGHKGKSSREHNFAP